MTASGDRLERALAAIDRANEQDPNVVEGDTGPIPKELHHAAAMTRWIHRLDPSPGEEQLIAARAHHLRRWTRPRDAYPGGRAGYLRWRLAARRQHAAEVAELLAPLGYDEDEIERIGALVAKTAPPSNPAMQAHEDALCLVFLELQADGTAAKLGADKAATVLARTLAKMSPAARAEARRLDLGPWTAVVADLCADLDGR